MADEGKRTVPSTAFKAGVSGNPGGWRRADIDEARKLGVYIRGEIWTEDGRNKLADRLLKIAMGDDDALAMKACEMLIDRCAGKAKQILDLRIGDGARDEAPSPEWESMTVEEKRGLLAAAERLALLTAQADGDKPTEH